MEKNEHTKNLKSSADLLAKIQLFLVKEEKRLDFNKVHRELERTYVKLQKYLLIPPETVQFFQDAFPNKKAIMEFIEQYFHQQVPLNLTRTSLNQMAAGLLLSTHSTTEELRQDPIFQKYSQNDPESFNFANIVDSNEISNDNQDYQDYQVWFQMSQGDLVEIFNDLRKFPTLDALVKAAHPILQETDQKIQNRTQLISRIIKRINEKKLLQKELH